jgi:hypothetical protein
MAKKKVLLWTNKPAGMPSKQCDNCSKYYFARYKQCPNCGADNPGVAGVARKTVKKKKGGKRRMARGGRGAAAAGTSNLLTAAIEFVQQAGGIDEAKQALSLVERIKRL